MNEDQGRQLAAMRNVFEEFQAQAEAQAEAIREAAHADVTALLDDAERRAAEIIENAEREAAYMLADAAAERDHAAAETRARLESGGAQLSELLELRERFTATMRAVIEDVGGELGRIERTGLPRPAEGAPPPPPAAELPPLAVDPEPEQFEEAGAEPAPTAVTVVTFEPLADFAAVASLERLLAAVPGVLDVYIRRFAGECATIELTVAEWTELPAALEPALPAGARIEPSDDGYRIRADRPVASEALE